MFMCVVAQNRFDVFILFEKKFTTINKFSEIRIVYSL